MIIDTHVHLDDERYREDFDEMMQRSREAGVQGYIIPGAHPSTLERAVELSEKYDEVYFAVGVHPNDVSTLDDVDFEHYASHPKCVAIGECGMDYYYLEGSDEEKSIEKKRQEEAFRYQIRMAKKLRKPLIVHIRDASHDAKMILLDEGAGDIGGVLHCFNADDELLSLSKHNFYFGIGGVVTFSNAKKLVNILPKIPHEKLLIETDGPYLTPHPHRGKRNESSYTVLVADKMADILGENSEDIRRLTTQNAYTLFSGIKSVLIKNCYNN